MIYKRYTEKLHTEQHEPHYKSGMNLGAPNG
jgi:hypothetical protein